MKALTGTVTSVKMNQTAVVTVETRWQHPLYKKTVKRTKKYPVHDTVGVKQGARVSITPIRPMSKTKRWKINQVIN